MTAAEVKAHVKEVSDYVKGSLALRAVGGDHVFNELAYVLKKLDQLAPADTAALEAQVADLQSQLATMTAERDQLQEQLDGQAGE